MSAGRRRTFVQRARLRFTYSSCGSQYWTMHEGGCIVQGMTTIALASAPFSISRLRVAFSGQFEKWQRAVEEGNTALARQARAAIRALAFEGLTDGPAAMGGFYLFIDPGQQDSLAGLNYIGIAEGRARPIGRRIVDRLRDDSALDSSLDQLGPEVARRVVHDRLVCALPQTGQNYVDKHLQVAELCRRSPTVVLIGSDEPKHTIRKAEKILIRSAVSAGAPVVNIQHRRFKGDASERAYEVAHAVIDQGVQHGLSSTGGKQWRSRLA